MCTTWSGKFLASECFSVLAVSHTVLISSSSWLQQAPVFLEVPWRNQETAEVLVASHWEWGHVVLCLVPDNLLFSHQAVWSQEEDDFCHCPMAQQRSAAQ